MPGNNIQYTVAKPDPSLEDFVESFWKLENTSEEEKEVVVLPDGRIDIFFSYSAHESYHVSIAGLASEASQSSIAPKTVIYAVSLKLLAAEYLLHMSVAPFINQVDLLTNDFFHIRREDISNFHRFCEMISSRIKALLIAPVDARKQKAFHLIYASQGDVTIQEISDRVAWSSRQMNRYFQQWFGLSMKAYCNILRYRAAFPQIKEGKLFPEGHFTDQAHFIREIKKYSGVTPKALAQNKNDRFIQFSTLPKK